MPKRYPAAFRRQVCQRLLAGEPAEIASRDESNVRTRMRQAAFPVTKRLEQFDVAASSIPPATFDYLTSLEWIRASENVCMIGPVGTGSPTT